MAIVYVYRMTEDSGRAPCAENGMLSLACCKGGQMRGGKVIQTGLRHLIGKRYFEGQKDDVYFIGTYQDQLLYCAKVTNVVTMEEYYGGMSKGRTDDIYSLKGKQLIRNNHLRAQGVHTEDDRVIKDLAGQYVLLSDEYVYLGKDATYVAVVAECNAKREETKTYNGDVADRIIEACMKHRDGKKHTPITPFPRKGGCK